MIRHEQIRSRARLHRASADVEGDLDARSMPTRWKRYYTDEHVETIMRRAIVSGINRTKVLDFRPPSFPAPPASTA